jgi:ankyrin repeat protein
MHKAIAKSDIKKVSDLLDKGANPDSLSPFGSTNLGSAVVRNEIKIVELLLSKGANPNLAGYAGECVPLSYAISQKNLEMVQLLLKYKANASYKFDYQASPIEYAQGILGYPSLNGSCHPIVALLLKSLEKTDIGDINDSSDLEE